METSKIAWGQPDKMLGGNLRWTSIPSRGSRNTPSRFILQKLEISASTDEPSGLHNYIWGRLYLYLDDCTYQLMMNELVALVLFFFSQLLH